MSFWLRVCLVFKRVKVGALLLFLLGAHDLMPPGFELSYVVDSEETLLHFSVATRRTLLQQTSRLDQRPAGEAQSQAWALGVHLA